MYIAVTPCTALRLPGNGSLSTDNAEPGTVAIATCDIGYIFPDSWTIHKYVACLEFAQWNDTLADCVGEYRIVTCVSDGSTNSLQSRFLKKLLFNNMIILNIL